MLLNDLEKLPDRFHPVLNFKIPIIESVEEVNSRVIETYKLMPGSSSQQMSIAIKASVNWRIVKSKVLGPLCKLRKIR